jgi:hypothetical protein
LKRQGDTPLKKTAFFFWILLPLFVASMAITMSPISKETGIAPVLFSLNGGHVAML